MSESSEDIERDKFAKQEKVVEEITKLVSTSTIPDLKALHDAISSGETLTATILTGGLTNYSYKVAVSDPAVKPVFVKLSFPYALWATDKDNYYDLQRTVNEFTMMDMFAKIAPGHVAEPFVCHHIPADDLNPYEMLMLVTEWCTSDEQLANQWLDGNVDARIAEQLGTAVAKLHLQPFDPEFNQAVNTTVADCVWPAAKEKFTELLSHDDGENNLTPPSSLLCTPCKRFGLLAREFGSEKLFCLVDRLKVSFESKEVFTHSDLHSFNILVEKKPDAAELAAFGPTGNFMLCDWEMASAGPVGRDFGTFSAFPVLCFLTNARLGHTAVALDLRSKLHLIVDAYLSALSAEGKDVEYVNAAYRNIIGFTGYFTMIYCVLRVHYDTLPVEGLELAKVLDSLGVITLKLLKLGFDDSTVGLTKTELRKRFNALLDIELNELTPQAGKRRNRRGSQLRASGTIISDSGVFTRDTRRVTLFKEKTIKENVTGAIGAISSAVKKGGVGVADGVKGLFKGEGEK